MIKKTSEVPAFVEIESNDSDDWTADNTKSLSLRYEEQLARTVVSIFGGGLENDGDVVQIRKVEGRLTWIKGNRSGEKWQELTPELARQIEVGAVLEAQKILNAEKEEKLKAIKVGWYQDFHGNLFQFDGTTWVGNEGASLLSHRVSVEDLEFLG